jgi:hypothetical protein
MIRVRAIAGESHLITISHGGARGADKTVQLESYSCLLADKESG